ncbi:hypothetical protein LguiA_023318 [Lonicera macranthoides]
MVTLQSSTFLSRYSNSSPTCSFIKANLNSHQFHKSKFPIPQRPSKVLIHELKTQNIPKIPPQNSSPKAVEEFYDIIEVVADRVEMHKNIGAQRDNWNSLLLTSINGMTVTGATMAGLATMAGGAGPALLALKLSSTLLYLSATGVLIVMNKIQPSQLAEEQRNASRLFKQLHEEFKSTIALKNITTSDVNTAIEKVLALDRAYPLPLLGTMLDKFPKKVEPAVWWPKRLNKTQVKVGLIGERNGWSEKLEEEMREIASVLKKKDGADYLRLSKLALQVSKILSICGPLFTGLAAIGAAIVGCGDIGGVVGVVFGAMATVVNTLEHGGQVGMVFEMYRSNAGFFRLMEESIEWNLEREVETRENGEVFEERVALELGRNLYELRDLASSKEEFASKLF